MNPKSLHDKVLTQLVENTGAISLLGASMRWMDELYDSDEALLRYPENPDRHMVRESIWYAFGLALESMVSGQPKVEAQRVKEIVSRVLENQYVDSGKIWHGTFKRFPTEREPSDGAVIWRDYDPNWRQFIGSVLLLLKNMLGSSSLLSLVPAIDSALVRCIEGEPVDRVPPTYTNIALMKAWLEVESGELVNEEVPERGLKYAREIALVFNENGAFAEYNSPTYYGINFYALGLWQIFSDALSEMGRNINKALWVDVSRYYHADMKNLCGPWSRSYGMDMQKYVAGLGLWIWAATDREFAPFPNLETEFEHRHDFCLGPLAAFSAVAIPSEVKHLFYSFDQPRNVRQQISNEPERKAEASITNNLMIGLESSIKSFHGAEQYHPLTIHWLDADETVNWCRLRFKGAVVGELMGNRIELILNADEGVDIASLVFCQEIKRIDQVVVCDGLSMSVETGVELQADAEHLHLLLPVGENNHRLTIICEVETKTSLVS